MIASIGDIDSEYIDRLDIAGSDAILCCNDILAITIYQAMLHKNIKIPSDIAITGFDKSPLRELFWDKLTTIDLPTGQLGMEAAEWLKNRIVNRENTMLQKLVPGIFIPGTTI